MTVRTIDEIFRDFVTDGVPASGPFNPHKPDIRDTLKALTEGSENFPDNRVIRLNNADEGTANNIVVTASVAIPVTAYQVLYILNVTQENTGSVTVSGAINRNLVTNTNHPIEPGYLVSGMALLCIDTGTELRLLSYGDAEAIQAAAEAAAIRAEVAASVAETAVGGLLSNFDTIATVAAATIPGSVNYVRIAGYAVAGDGGHALYRRVTSEPSHAAKVQSSDGSWWEMDMRNGVNVLQFGAKGNGGGDDTLAIQNAIDALDAVGGGVVQLPRGRYPVTGLKVTQRAIDWHSNKRVSLLGDGSGLVTLRYIGQSDGIVIVWDTDLSTNTDNTGRNSWARIGGFCIEGANIALVGLNVIAKSWFMMDDIRIIQCTGSSFKIDGTLSWSGRALRSYGGQYGFNIQKSSDPRASSMPNNINLYDITVGNSTKWGMYLRNVGPINIFGGSVEGNGTQGDIDAGGIYVIRNDAGIGIEGTAINIHGVYFEQNKGRADVLFAQQSNSYKMAANVQGCIFNRINSAAYTTNNIHSQPVGTATLSVDISGCSFSYAGSYAPDAGRRCISIGGDVTKISALNVHPSNVFLSSVDNWSDLNGPWVLPSGNEFAGARVNATGAIARKKNVSTITKDGTGTYKVLFNYPARSAAPQVIGSIVGGSGQLTISAESATGVTIQTYDASGTAADRAFSFTANDN